MANQLFNTEVIKSKTSAMQTSLQKLVDVKNELAEFGIIVKEDCISIDKEKQGAYWSGAFVTNPNY